jgi:glycosyltransferase 2 family protein
VAGTQRKLLRAAQWIFAALVLFFAGRALFHQWSRAEERLLHVQLHWGALLAASMLVIVTYAILIEGWRRVLAAWGGRLDYLPAARIWCLSNLGRYIPGNVWSLTAMGMMARERGLSGIAAAGSSVVMQLLTLASGLGIVLLTGADLIGKPPLIALAAVFLIAFILLAPRFLPRLVTWLGRVTGREIEEPRIPAGTIWVASLAASASWVLYGVAFKLYAVGLLGAASGATMSYIAVYTAAYILGFISPIAPAGLGVREVALAAGMTQLGLASGGDAALLAITARLWLTVLELIPSAGFVAALAIGRKSTSK